MKKLFFCVFLLMSTSTIAQEVFIGITGGPAERFNSNNPTNYPSTDIIEKGVYFRLNTKGNLSFTGSILHYGNRSIITDAVIFDVDYTVEYVKVLYNYLEFRYGIQYNITPKKLKAVGINQYVGIQVANRKSLQSYKHYYEYPNGEKGDFVNNEGQLEYLGGISYAVVYNISRLQIGLNTAIMAGDKDYNKWGRNYYVNDLYPSSIMSANLCIGYKL